MLLHHTGGARDQAHPGILFVLALVVLMLLGADAAAAGARVADVPDPAPAGLTPNTPDVRDTPTNLQAVFTNEMNAKERYLAFAKQADLEGYNSVANLFRACAEAEAVHAHAHVIAIAWTGGQARAVLERIDVGSTAQNLKTAIAGEWYEANALYPALAHHARAEHRPEAVRSMTYALSAEREHVRLFSAALAGLESCPVVQAIYVCPHCGKTAEARPDGKCSCCFTPAWRFRKIG